MFSLCCLPVVFHDCDWTKIQFHCRGLSPGPKHPTRPKNRSQTCKRFNLEWLFNANSSSKSPWKTPSEVYQHIETLGKVIDMVDADVWILQEVQSDCSVLERLRTSLFDPELYRFYLLKGTDTSTGQNVALLTKIDPIANLKRTSERANYPVQGTSCTSSDSGDTGISKHFYTVLDVENFGKIGIIGLHLLAFPDDQNRCVQREAQAVVASNLARTLYESESLDGLVIAGDFNDFSNSVPDCCGNVPISKVVSIICDRTLAEPMMQAASFIAPAERYSYQPPYKGQIDHLIVSEKLSRKITSSWIDHSITQKINPFMSDHWPLVVRFQSDSDSLRQQSHGNSERSSNRIFLVAGLVVLLVVTFTLLEIRLL